MLIHGAPDLHPDSRLIVGIEPDPKEPETYRVLLGSQHSGVHTHVKDPDAIRELQKAWADSSMGHLTTRVPPEALCVCDATLAQKAAFYGGQQ